MSAPNETSSEPVDRFRLLVDAGISLSSELELGALLRRIVGVAAELCGARYAALAVLDSSGHGLESFLTIGIDESTRAAIGSEPEGRGLLGEVVRSARPLRLRNIADDPRSVGFPPNHPRMTSFLGVPIRRRARAYGNLYLCDKWDGTEFTEEDEELTKLFAAQAAVAVENARLHESSTRWLRQLESLNEIGTALASQFELEPVLGTVAARLRELVHARLVLIALADQPGSLRVAATDGEHADAVVGTRLALGTSKVGRVLDRGYSERVDSVLDDPEVDHEVADRIGAETALYIPLVGHGRPIGVIVAHDKHGADARFSDEDLQLGESLAQRAAIAVELSQRVSRDAVRRVVEAQELERQRLARELHDETGQALTSILLGLKTLEQTIRTDAAREEVSSVRALVVSTLQSVRRLAVELRPAALDDFGLGPAIERLVDTYRHDASIDVDVELQIGSERLPTDVETTMYRIVQEALTNISKHADATKVSVLLTRKERAAVVVVEDDGNGFDPTTTTSGLGLTGMRERIALVGGRLRVETRPGRGTTIAAEVPLA